MLSNNGNRFLSSSCVSRAVPFSCACSSSCRASSAFLCRYSVTLSGWKRHDSSFITGFNTFSVLPYLNSGAAVISTGPAAGSFLYFLPPLIRSCSNLTAAAAPAATAAGRPYLDIPSRPVKYHIPPSIARNIRKHWSVLVILAVAAAAFILPVYFSSVKCSFESSFPTCSYIGRTLPIPSIALFSSGMYVLNSSSVLCCSLLSSLLSSLRLKITSSVSLKCLKRSDIP